MPDRNGYIGRAPSDSTVTVSRQSFTVSGITTEFTFSSGYVPGYFDIYINGVKMIEGSDYTSSDGSTFSVLNGGASDGDAIEAVAYKAFNAAAVTNASNLTVSGDLTVLGSSSFAGSGTSVGFARTAFNLSGSPDITVRNITGVAATFSGAVSYEDVVNIDSVGVVTARSGIEFGLSGVGGTVTATGQAEFVGVVTANKFVGDGSGLTGVASTDNIITGTAATFTGDVNFSGITTVGVLTAYTTVTVGTAITADAASGIVTATGVNVTGVVTAANVSVGSSVTAATFYGSGQNLTNLPAGGDSLDVTASLFI